MSRLLIFVAWLCVALFPLAGDGLAGETVLPEGSAPPPIVDGYFPNRLYEFVWRNWNLAEPKKLAKIVARRSKTLRRSPSRWACPRSGRYRPK